MNYKKEKIFNFQGNCIYITNTTYSLSQLEKEYIKNLKYISKDDQIFISKDSNIIDNSLCSNLNQILDNYAEDYIRNILEINHKLKRLNSWVTVNKQGSSHHLHNHPNTFISLCFYPQVENSSINFYAPNTTLEANTNLSFNVINPNIFNTEKLYINLSPKDIVIFPGWVNHSGGINNSNVDRVMIGVNYFISGNLGSPISKNELKLL